jgi:hypothetical protein
MNPTSESRDGRAPGQSRAVRQFALALQDKNAYKTV